MRFAPDRYATMDQHGPEPSFGILVGSLVFRNAVVLSRCGGVRFPFLNFLRYIQLARLPAPSPTVQERIAISLIRSRPWTSRRFPFSSIH